jgi:hypothetical protein
MTASQPVSSSSAIVKGWLTARSIARGRPAPTDDSGGWRVETNAPDEIRRYVFAEATGGLGEIGRSVDEPRVLLKLFGSEEAMRSALPHKWQVKSAGHFMTLSGEVGATPALPIGYEATVMTSGDVVQATVRSSDGVTVASGFAAETSDCFVYDRIFTDAAHRRRGFARAVMIILGAVRKSPGTPQVLVATEQGRGLYLTMGWSVLSPWTTAFIPEA